MYYQIKGDSITLRDTYYTKKDVYKTLAYGEKTYHYSITKNRMELVGKEHTFTLKKRPYPYHYNPRNKLIRVKSLKKLKTNHRKYLVGDTITAKLRKAAGMVPSCDLQLQYWIEKKTGGKWEPYYASSLDKGSCTDLYANMALAKKLTYKISIRYVRQPQSKQEFIRKEADSVMGSKRTVINTEYLSHLWKNELPEPIIKEPGTYRLLVINTPYSGGYNLPWHRNKFLGDYRYLYSNRFKVRE